jgi:hypothetical protein
VRRWTAVAAAAAIVLAFAGAPAYAKEVGGASIQGGGVTVRVADRPGTGGLADLADVTGVWTYAGDAPIAFVPEPAVRGPAYVVSYRVDSGIFRQELYPDSSAGSLIYTPPGQMLLGTPSRGGWTESGVNLALFLRAYGIRVIDERATAPAAAADDAPGASPVAAIAAIAAIAVALLAGTMLVLRRRRART